MSANPATGLLDPCVCRVSVRKVSTYLLLLAGTTASVLLLVTSCFFGSKKNCVDGGGKGGLFGPGCGSNGAFLSSEGV